MPAFKNTNSLSSSPVDNSILVTDQPDRCYSDELTVFGKGPESLQEKDAPQPKYEKLQGSRVYALREKWYEVVFEPIPMSVKVHNGTRTTTVSALGECK